MSNERTIPTRVARPTRPAEAPCQRHPRALSKAALVGLLGLLLSACGDEKNALAPGPEAVLVEATPPAKWLANPRALARELDATTVDGVDLWTAFLSKRNAVGKVDQVSLVVRMLDSTGKSLEATLARSSALAAPTIAAVDGGVCVVWEDESKGAPCLMGIVVKVDTNTGQLVPSEAVVISDEFPARLPELVALPGGGIALAWQALVGTNYELYLSQLPSAGAGTATWTAPLRLTHNEADEWSPSLAATGTASDPLLHLAFDRFVPGGPNGFDVVHMQLKLGANMTPGRETLVATGPNYQAYPSIATNPAVEDEVWIAYEEAPQFGEYGALRSRRTTRLAKLTIAPGQVEVAHALLPKSFANAQRGDFPEVAIGPAGLALTRRLPNTDFKPINSARNAFYSTWRTSATTFDTAGRGIDVELPETDGDNHNDASMVPTADGFHFVFTTDARSSGFAAKRSFDDAIESDWHLGVIALGNAAGFPLTKPGAAVPALETASVRSAGVPFAARKSSDFFGDLHRHTHLSRCAGTRDGTFLDAVRYSRGPGALDFVSVTDHYQHLTPGSWWQSKRNTERWNAPGSLLVFPGIERNVPTSGHQNLIWQDGAPLLNSTRTSMPTDFMPGQVIAIPHMTSLPENLFRWPAFDPARHKLVEIHQGLRGSYEGQDLPLSAIGNQGADGQVTRLARMLGEQPGGDLPGMISSSDHGTSSHGYAAVHLAPGQEASRASIFAAMLKGETTATTGPPPTQDALPRNVEIEVQPSGLKLTASAAELAYIEIVRNGALHGRVSGTRFAAIAAPTPLMETGPPMIRVMLSPTVIQLSKLPLALQLPTQKEAAGKELFAFSDVRLQRNIGNGVHVAPSSPHQLELTIPRHTRATTALSFNMPFTANLELTYGADTMSWNPRNAIVGETFRGSLRAESRRPMVDITLMGFESPTAAIDGGSFIGQYPGAGADEAEAGVLEPGVYYARAVWLDGNMAWSRFVRIPAE
ncbi:MAG: hypothetical protein ACI84E_001363 [Planctomycetota bacterium]|jgi:hypothetical protein